jgi:hypothetical protein
MNQGGDGASAFRRPSRRRIGALRGRARFHRPGTQDDLTAAVLQRAITKERTMAKTKTRQEREQELQALMSTPEGRAELEALATRYQEGGSSSRPQRTSVITYILVHERQKGLIVD